MHSLMKIAEQISPKIRNMLIVFSVLLFSLFNIAAAEVPTTISIQEGLKIVIAENRVVRIAKLGEDIAKSDTHIARSGLLPSLNASASYTSLANQPALIVGNQALSTSDSRYYAYSINIQQILFDFQGNLSRYDASRMLLEAKKFDTIRNKNLIAFEFTLAFYDFLESQHLVESAEKEINRLEAHLRDAHQLFTAGVITRNDLLQAQVRLSDARQKLLSVQNLEAVRAAKLNNLLLRPLSSEIRAADVVRTAEQPFEPVLEILWEEALQRRSEIHIVDQTLKAIDFEAAVQKSEFLPKLYVRGANDFMENSYLQHESNWSVVLGVTVNLFEGGRSVAELRKTESRKKQLLEQRAKLVDEIKLELKRYCLDHQTASARILANRDAVEQAQENLRINKRRYEEGEGTATEVLDAVTLLTVAETNHIRSVYDYQKAEAAIHYAAGRDFLEVYK